MTRPQFGLSSVVSHTNPVALNTNFEIEEFKVFFFSKAPRQGEILSPGLPENQPSSGNPSILTVSTNVPSSIFLRQLDVFHNK